MPARAYIGPDSTQPEGRKGLSQRLKERGPLVVVGKVGVGAGGSERPDIRTDAPSVDSSLAKLSAGGGR